MWLDRAFPCGCLDPKSFTDAADFCCKFFLLLPGADVLDDAVGKNDIILVFSDISHVACIALHDADVMIWRATGVPVDQVDVQAVDGFNHGLMGQPTPWVAADIKHAHIQRGANLF